MGTQWSPLMTRWLGESTNSTPNEAPSLKLLGTSSVAGEWKLTDGKGHDVQLVSDQFHHLPFLERCGPATQH